MANNKKKIIPMIVLAAAISLIVYLNLKDDQTFIGVVEAAIFPNISTVSGQILEMPVELGQHVSKGDLIARIDGTNQKYAYDQLMLTLNKKKLALSELQAGAGDTQAANNIAIAQSNYNSADSTNQKAALDYENAQSLYSQGAISMDVLDKARVSAELAANALTAAKAQLDNARNDSSAKSMQFDIQQTESQLKEAKEKLDKFTVIAATDGVIMSKSYVLGDVVASGYNIADIAADGEKYFTFYLPADYVNSVDYGKAYKIESGGKEYEAIVKYIDVKSEYTPKDMQTMANKNKESIKIKLLLPKDCPLKPGQEAKLKLNLEKLQPVN